MKKNLLKEAKKLLSKDYKSPDDEWNTLNPLAHAEPRRTELLTWIFANSPAYWETRARAGLILFKQNTQETWRIVEALVDSSDPDDNGTALTLFENLDDPHTFELAYRWLTRQTHPSTQLDASVYLRETYPEQVKQQLTRLMQHKDKNVRRRAQMLLSDFEY